MGRAIPFILSVDVEPDGFQFAAERTRSTTGYDALVDFVGGLRPSLEHATGRRASFGWFFRMDPQIEQVFGRADHLATAFGTRTQDLIDAGDHVGLHTHLVRWSKEQDAWVHDVTDREWTCDVIDSSFAAFERCFGTPCQRHRMGAGLFNQDIVDALDRAGARVESAIEPIRGGGADGHAVGSGVDMSPLVGRNEDCARAPRRPYRAAADDFLRPARQRQGIALVPLTTSWLSPNRPAWQTVAGYALKLRRRPQARALYLAEGPSPRQYWDLVARQLRLMRRPYVNVAIRTGAADSPYLARVHAALEALVEHPLASRIEVVDPLAALSQLLDEPARIADRQPVG